MDMNELLSTLGNSDMFNNTGTNELLGSLLKSGGFGGLGNLALIVLAALFLFGSGGGNNFLGANNQCCCSCKRHKHHHHHRRCC